MSKEYNKLDFRIGMVDGKADYDETLKLSKMSPEQFVELFSGDKPSTHWCKASHTLGYPKTGEKCNGVGCHSEGCPFDIIEGSHELLAKWLERAKDDIAKPTEPATPRYNVGDKVWYVISGGKITEDKIKKIVIDADGTTYRLEQHLIVNLEGLYSNKADALDGILNINKVSMETKLSIEE